MSDPPHPKDVGVIIDSATWYGIALPVSVPLTILATFGLPEVPNSSFFAADGAKEEKESSATRIFGRTFMVMIKVQVENTPLDGLTSRVEPMEWTSVSSCV